MEVPLVWRELEGLRTPVPAGEAMKGAEQSFGVLLWPGRALTGLRASKRLPAWRSDPPDAEDTEG